MNYPEKIDLHIHTIISDGTDTPAELLARVKEQGIQLYSVTDHDAVQGCVDTLRILKDGDPLFTPGVEFSCRDSRGKYHILGFGYDPDAEPVRRIVENGRLYRIEKVHGRLRLLAEKRGIVFSDEEIRELLSLYNPGKPHIAKLMVHHGYADTKTEAIRDIDRLHYRGKYVTPEQAISGILESGGIPVLAHPCFGTGTQYITGEDMDERLRHLIGYGLQGVEAFYSGFPKILTEEMLEFAEQYHLYVTAGSDYHGTNKPVLLGETNFSGRDEMPDGMRRFFDAVLKKSEGRYGHV